MERCPVSKTAIPDDKFDKAVSLIRKVVDTYQEFAFLMHALDAEHEASVIQKAILESEMARGESISKSLGGH